MREKLIIVGLLILVGVGIGFGIYFQQESIKLEGRLKAIEEKAGIKAEEIIREKEVTKETCRFLPTLSPASKLAKEVGSNIARDICWLVFALSENVPELCEKIEFPEVSSMCYEEFARNRKDPSFCEKIKEEPGAIRCYSDLATLLKDLSLCEKIDWRQRDSCFLGYAKENVEAAVCEKIITVWIKDNCYREIAQITGNSSLCEKIKNLEERKSCQEFFKY